MFVVRQTTNTTVTKSTAKLNQISQVSNYCLVFILSFFEKKSLFPEYEQKNTEQEERLARFAKAMGHPTRIAILKFLASQDCCFFGDIHEVLPIAKATVSQHLNILKEAGLIQGEIFPPKVRYCINSENRHSMLKLFSSNNNRNIRNFM